MKEPEKDILKQFGLDDDPKLRDFLQGIDRIKKPVGTKEDAWARFEQSIIEKPVIKSERKVLNISFALKIAASILLVISAWYGFMKWNQTVYLTENKQISNVFLPDRSEVIMNAASKLTFDKFRWGKNRVVELSGEGLFKVKKGSSFEIHTFGKTIRVLGTEFNVFSRDDYFEVKCISGKVEVHIPGSENVLLEKGKAIRQEADNKPVVQFDSPNSSSEWINGDFYYQDADLHLVFDEVARQFNVCIDVTANIENRKYSGYFNKSSIEEAIKNVCLPMGLMYTISNDSIIIR